MKNIQYVVLVTCLLTTVSALGNVTVPMHVTSAQGVGKSAGTVLISETKYGLLFTPQLQGLTPGLHGFHIHQNPVCDQNGMTAGGHLDLQNTGKHLGPYNDNGHLGDLPALYVNADGSATLPVLAPRLMHLSEITAHSLMVHVGGDNYSDNPEKLGGGGKRMLCAIIK